MTQPLYPGGYPGSYPTTGGAGTVLSGVLPAITASLAGTVTASGALSATLPAATAALTSGGGSVTGALSGTLTALTGALTSAGTGFGSTLFGSTPFGSDDAGGTLVATLPTLAAAFTSSTGTAGGLVATLPPLAVAFSATGGAAGALVATLTAPGGAFTAAIITTGTLTAAVPALVAGFTTGHNIGVLAATLPAAVGAFTTTAPAGIAYGFHAGKPIPARSSRPGLTQGVRVSRYNLHINQGETWQLTVPVLPDDPTTPATLAGLVGQAQIRSEPASAVVLHEWSTAAGNLTITDDAVILTLPGATSSAWTWRRGVWDLELTDPGNGGTTRLLQGWVYVTPEITR